MCGEVMPLFVSLEMQIYADSPMLPTITMVGVRGRSFTMLELDITHNEIFKKLLCFQGVQGNGKPPRSGLNGHVVIHFDFNGPNYLALFFDLKQNLHVLAT
jgi:hypothetical protein